MDNLLTPTQSANKMGVSRQTIYNWIKWGLPTVEVAGMKLIRQEDLENFKAPKPGPKGKGQ